MRKLEQGRNGRKTLLAGGLRGQPLSHANRSGQISALLLFQQRLIVKRINLGRAATLEKVNYALRFGREVGQTGQRLAGQQVAIEKMSQGGNAYADEVCSQQVSTQPLTYALCFGDSGAVEAGTGSDEGSVDGTLDAPESAGDEAGEGGFDAMPDALPSDAQGLDDAMEIDAAADGD